MAKQAVRKTGYTKNTPKSYVVDAGAVYKNLEWNAETKKWEGELLGATSDGNKVTIEKNYREVEVDGVKTKAVGLKILESQNATLETNVKELTAENIALALGAEVTSGDGVSAPENYKIITSKGTVETSDYLKNIALVGTISGTKDPIIIVLDNALCTSGLEMELKDNDEAVVAMTFEAHADEDQVEDLTLPARIYYPQVSLEV